MDVESRDFKSYQQVPKWWTRFMTIAVSVAFIIAVIALALGATALNDDDDEKEGAQFVASRSSSSNSSTENSAMSGDDSTLATRPGSSDYRGVRAPRSGRGQAPRLFHVITHGHVDEDYFFKLQKGIDDAAKSFHVDVSYLNANTPDDEEDVIERIKKAQTSLSDGLAVSFVEHTSRMGQALREASYDIPVITMLQDEDVYDGFRVFLYVGMGFSHELGGIDAARTFSTNGIQNVLCLMDDRAIFGRQEMCTALTTEFESVEGGSVNGQAAGDFRTVREMISNAVQNANASAIFTHTAFLFGIAHDYLMQEGRLCTNNRRPSDTNCVLLGTVEATARTLNAVVDGSSAFVLDRQHYLLGYSAILFLQMHRTGLVPGAMRFIFTGPTLIDSASLAVKHLSVDILEGKTAGDKQPEDLNVRFIVHGHVSDPFWIQVKNGIRIAARRTGVNVDLRHPNIDVVSMDAVIQGMIGLIEEAETDGVDAIVITLPRDDDELKQALRGFSTRTGGTPIISINAGHAYINDYPIRTHVGVIETLESSVVGQQLVELDVERLICVVYQADDENLRERCNGLASGVALNVTIIDSHRGNDFHVGMTNEFNVIKNAVLRQLETEDIRYQAVVSSGLYATGGVHAAIAELDRFCRGNIRPNPNRDDSCIVFATFDLDPHIFNYIKNDEMQFAVDQQPELQGYLPVYFAMIDALYINHPLGLVATGPRFVNSTNVLEVETIFGFLTA